MQMELVTLDTEAFKALKLEFGRIVKQALIDVLAEKKASQTSDWIPFEEAKTLLNIRSKTSFQKLRDNGIILFTQSGRKILYSRKSIMNYLNKNIIKF